MLKNLGKLVKGVDQKLVLAKLQALKKGVGKTDAEVE